MARPLENTETNMNTISRLEAIRQLRERVETVLSTDDVIEVHRELSPEDGTDRTTLERDPEALKNQVLSELVDQLDGVTVEEVWSVVFPEHRRVEFDADSDVLKYKTNPAAVA